MTIKVTITSNFGNNTVLVDSASTPRQILQENEIDLSRGAWNLNGYTLDQEDMDTTMDELGAPERSYLSRVAKTENAVR